MRWLPTWVLLLGVLLLFAPGLRGDFVWDDVFLIRDNPGLRQAVGLWRFIGTSLWEISGTPEHWIESGQRYYRPFVKLAYWLEYRFFGPRPLGYHVVSLLLHAACVLLAHAWLRRRLRTRRAGVAAALLGAALFAVHPSRPEAVSWISGCADLWLAFWILLGLTAWERARGGAALAAACWAIAFLCKEVAALVPMALAIDLLCAQSPRRGAMLRRLGAASLPLAALFALRLQLAPVASPGDPTRGPPIVAASAGHYLALVVWPWRPSTQVGLAQPDGRHHPETWAIVVGGAACAAFLILAVAAVRRRRFRPWLSDLSWFVVPLFPVLNIVPLGYSVLVAERFLYFPLLGVSAATARALSFALERGARVRALTMLLCALLGAGYAATSLRHILHFQSGLQLWQYEVQQQPTSPVLQRSLAWAEWKAGHAVKAMQAARASYAQAVLPQDRADAAVAWAAFQLQTASDAEQDLLTRIRVFLDAIVTGQSGAARLVMDDFDITVELAAGISVRFGHDQSFRNHRALAHARTLSLDEAERQLRELAVIETGSSSLTNLARVLAFQERWREALGVLNQALLREPHHAALQELHPTLVQGMRLPRAGTLEPRLEPTAQEAALPSAETIVRAGIERARVTLALTSPELARLVLDRHLHSHPQDPRLTVARAAVDAADARPDLARQRLLEAHSAAPAVASIWDAALKKLAPQDEVGRPRRRLRLP